MGKRLTCLWLDFITFPSLFMTNKARGKYHVKYICPKCPKWRKEMTDIYGMGDCWWHHNWSKKNYDISRTFGIKNWILRCILLKTDLSNYK